jgi:hypothetical protein
VPGSDAQPGRPAAVPAVNGSLLSTSPPALTPAAAPASTQPDLIAAVCQLAEALVRLHSLLLLLLLLLVPHPVSSLLIPLRQLAAC